MNDRAAARKFATLMDPPALDIEAIVASATVAEKVAFLCGKGLWRTAPIDRLRVPAVVMTDGTHGVRYSESQIDLGQSWGRREAGASSLPPEAGSAPSRFADVDTVPATVAFGESRPATCFPTGSSLACSWDPDLARLMGNALAEECLQMGVGVLLGPGINIRRTPLAGRSYEYYSEDPYLTGELAAAIIIGIQEKGVGACLKHFACNNSEFQRTQMDSVVDERALREIYLAAFEHAIRKADPWLVMSSYNRLNGQQASENRWLLERVLREEWSYTGVVVSDWYGTKDRPKSLLAGNDISMPEYAVDQKELLQAAESGVVPLEVLDRSVIRLLKLVVKATSHRKPGHQADLLAHHKLAQRIARESIVLLKNEDALLPIDLNRPCKVLVAGPCAVTPVIQGAGCATTTPWMLDKPLDEIVEIAGSSMSIAYAAGTATDGTRNPQALEHVSALAAESDLVLLFVSSPIGEDGENGDRSDLRILAAHEELIERIAAVQGNLVVIVASSDSVEMPWLPKVKALVHLFYAGQGMGRAVAEIVFGLANPCGRLTTTAPNTLEETPAFLHYPGENLRNLYAEGLYVGYRYYDRRKMQPLFPFGFGLSYTSFEYEKIVLSDRLFGEEDTITIEVAIRNVGTRAGKEVVQIYIEGPPGRLARPPLELKAFAKVDLQPGERQVTHLQIPVARLACYDTALAAWIVETGRYRILAGSSSRDIRLSAEAQVGAQERLPPLREDCSLQDLMRHVAAFTRVCELFARKSGKSLEEARANLRINAPDIFTSVYIALTSTFELDIDREEFRQALHGD